MKKSIFTLLLSLCFAVTMSAQMVTPVKWQSSFKVGNKNSNECVATFVAKIEKGWHMYAMDIPDVGISPLSVKWEKLDGVKPVGKLTPSRKATESFDEMFGATLQWWTESVTLTQRFEITKPNVVVSGYLEYSACNDENCIPPTSESFDFKADASAAFTGKAEQNSAEEEAPNEETVAVAESDSVAAADAVVAAGDVDLWAPVDATNDDTQAEDTTSMWYIIFTCFVGGLVALLTPCVWPMIPLTVSFFLKKGNSRAKSIRDALIYGLSIIAIYVLLGLLVTAIFGASSLNALSTSAVCNIIFFLLLVVFAVSFFGAFEIKLPDSWANKMDSTAEKTTGLLSIFFMAFTLTLVSFSCTGPIIGTLLVEAASKGNILGPAMGMLSFSVALAIPFCLFAMFPSLLKELPKSGGWMNTVKVVLGFVELALSLKFLSVADLAYGWHILDREVFLALWIVIFALLGFYLLGKITFSHYGPEKGGIGVFRFFLAMVSLSFTVYMIPGLWGAPLKGISAFAPPLETQDFNLYDEVLAEYDDYDAGMEAAAKAGKPVFLEFSGYGCVNCRKMEGAVLNDENIKQNIRENFVMITLMVDEKKELPAPIEVEENGRKVKLRTVGDRWSYLQRYKFNANAQPYYVVLDEKGNLLSGPYSYDENKEHFTKFLQDGKTSYKK